MSLFVISTCTITASISRLPENYQTKNNKFSNSSTIKRGLRIFSNGVIHLTGVKNPATIREKLKNLIPLSDLSNIEIRMVNAFAVRKDVKPLDEIADDLRGKGFNVHLDFERYCALRVKMVGFTLLVFPKTKIGISANSYESFQEAKKLCYELKLC